MKILNMEFNVLLSRPEWVVLLLTVVSTGTSGEASKICAASKEPDVKHFDIRLPEIVVPEEDTHYVCQRFKV